MSRRHTIVLLIPSLQGNGAERVVITLAKAFRDDGHAPHIVVLNDVVELPVDDDIPVHQFSMRHARALPRSIRGRLLAPVIDRFVRRRCGEPDLVISNLDRVDRIAAFSRLPGVHIVVHNTLSSEVPGMVKPSKVRSAMRERLGQFRRKPCVCVSQGVADDLCTLLPDKTDITRIYNPLDLDLIRQQAAADPPPDIPPDAIVNIAKFHSRKGQDMLIRAHARSGVPQPLVLLGQGNELNACRRLSEELGTADRVHFAGFQTNPFAILKTACCFALASRFEGLGMVLLEALALDIPTISTDCPCGPSEILPPSHLVPVDDEQAMANKLREVCAAPGEWTIDFPTAFKPDALVNAWLGLIDAPAATR